MKIFETCNIPEKFPNPVLTIGNYDGIHRGHRQIIELTKEGADRIGGTPMLMTFHPHPLSILRPECLLGLITPPDVKRRLIEETGIEVMFDIPFTREFAAVEPESFVEDILIEKIGIKGLIVGFDFKFGRFGRGSTEMLQYYGESYGFFFQIVQPICIEDYKVGSNKIRNLVLSGDIRQANQFLGRPYCISGRVVKGDQRGASIGFPTINLETEYDLIPPNGVYVSDVRLDNKTLSSITNIGTKPTFGGTDSSIETHIFDFNSDIYGKTVTLCFYERLREERKFESVDALVSQIGFDVEQALLFFGRASTK